MSEPSPFLYLTTTGWKSDQPREIEIRFVELERSISGCQPPLRLWKGGDAKLVTAQTATQGGVM
ncbi:MAG: hypothetical protein ACYDBJ_27590 [Aggregatilineales bacterium]